jgi:hypothetical protein
MANILIHRFDAAQESGNLADGEWWLRKTLKLTVLSARLVIPREDDRKTGVENALAQG